MLKPEEITEEQWRAAMSTYHKWIRKNPGMAWQAVCAEIMNRFHEQMVVAQIEAARAAELAALRDEARLGDGEDSWEDYNRRIIEVEKNAAAIRAINSK